MATSTVPGRIEKRRLGNTPMYINHFRSSHQILFNHLRCTIDSFTKFKNRIYYKIDIPRLAWCLSFYKDRHTLYIKVVSERFSKKIECFMLYNEKNRIKVQETERYKYQIPLVSIQVPENQFYDIGWLYLEFRFEERGETTPGIRPFICSKDDEDICMFFNNLREAYPGYRSELNFSLLTMNGHYRIPKGILAARCKFFYNYLKQNPDSTEYPLLDANYHTFEKLGNYIAYGHTHQPNELEVMIGLFMLAVFLKIPSLQSQCEEALKENINLDNVHQIREAGVKSGTESLVRAADEFLRKKSET